MLLNCIIWCWEVFFCIIYSTIIDVTDFRLPKECVWSHCNKHQRAPVSYCLLFPFVFSKARCKDIPDAIVTRQTARRGSRNICFEHFKYLFFFHFPVCCCCCRSGKRKSMSCYKYPSSQCQVAGLTWLNEYDTAVFQFDSPCRSCRSQRRHQDLTVWKEGSPRRRSHIVSV